MYTYQIKGQISYLYANFAGKHVVFTKNLHSWKYLYTTAGRDGRDKFQVWKGGVAGISTTVVVIITLVTKFHFGFELKI